MRADVQVEEDPAGAAAGVLARASGQVVLTGGSTPRSAYARAAELRSDWSGVGVWFSDERCVPPDHEQSNYAMARAALLDRARGAEVHRIPAERGPEQGADAYEAELAGAFERTPTFDLMLLGIGPDAHICSLFPGDAALGERERPATGVPRPGMAPLVARVTLTLPVVNAAHELVFLVAGEEKAEALRRATGPPDPSAPASLVEREATVICDRAAAGSLG